MLTLLTLVSGVFSADPVQLQLFFESECPFCQQFITGSLQEAWGHGPEFQKVCNFTLYPFGNAKETKGDGNSYTYTCQHGERECQGNLVEACVWGLSGNNATFYMPFMFEFEGLLSKDKNTDVMKLAEQAGAAVKWDDQTVSDLGDCYSKPEGNRFQHQVAELTAALDPPHQYVPWLVLNGEHTDAIQQSCQSNLLQCVCKEYKGTSTLCDNVNRFVVADPTHKTGHTHREIPSMIKRFTSNSE